VTSPISVRRAKGSLIHSCRASLNPELPQVRNGVRKPDLPFQNIQCPYEQCSCHARVGCIRANSFQAGQSSRPTWHSRPGSDPRHLLARKSPQHRWERLSPIRFSFTGAAPILGPSLSAACGRAAKRKTLITMQSSTQPPKAVLRPMSAGRPFVARIGHWPHALTTDGPSVWIRAHGHSKPLRGLSVRVAEEVRHHASGVIAHPNFHQAKRNEG
jgi:hypothetical protein